VLNVILQISLCFIVVCWLAFETYDVDLSSELSLWRLGVPNVDMDKLCDHDPTLSNHFYQADLYDDTSTYIKETFTSMVERGPLLCTVVIFLWTLHVAEVIRDAVHFMQAIWHRSGDVLSVRHHQDQFCIKSLDKSRLRWAMFSGILQIGIAGSLLVAGSFWLVYTRSMADLMLNAVVLDYVLQVDELIYKVVIPEQVKVLISRLEPLEMGGISQREMGSINQREMGGINQRSVPRKSMVIISCSSMFGLFMLVGFTLPHSKSAHEIAKAVCPHI